MKNGKTIHNLIACALIILFASACGMAGGEGEAEQNQRIAELEAEKKKLEADIERTAAELAASEAAKIKAVQDAAIAAAGGGNTAPNTPAPASTGNSATAD